MAVFIHLHKDWASFTWDAETLLPTLGKVRNLQGKLSGKMVSLGIALKLDAFLETIILDVLKTSEIEGEFLPSDQVRSSVARHLGMDIAGLVPSDRNVDGVVEMTLDAARNYHQP